MLTLLVAAVIALVDGASRRGEPVLVRFGDATAILLIVAINAVIGFVQERRAEAALAALEKMQTPNARVRRDNEVEVIAASRLVAGDILELEAGDAVPADARLLQTITLFVEESSLTGESVPVEKDARAAVADDAPLGDRSTMLFLGTTHRARQGPRGGRGDRAADGARPPLGAHPQAARPDDAPRGEARRRSASASSGRASPSPGVLFARGMMHGGRSWHELLLEAVSLAVAAIPEGLPAITTITLALGMQRMARRGAIVRKLAAVETLGAATVICTDKTGTLTQNEMTVRVVYAGGERFTVTGTGYDPKGEVLGVDGKRMEQPGGPLQGDLLASVSLCNNAILQLRDGRLAGAGRPHRGRAAHARGQGRRVARAIVASSNQIVKELPFDSDRKRMTIVDVRRGGPREVVHSKGSADVLVPLCSRYESTAEGPQASRRGVAPKAILGENDRMSGQALRVLAVARRELGRPSTSQLQEAGGGKHLSLRPKFVLEDAPDLRGARRDDRPAPRPGVKEAVRQVCRGTGCAR